MSNKDKPFHMTIVGKTGTGKTWYLTDLLEREYKHHFNFIFLICPTVEYNETWQNWKYLRDPDFIVVPSTIQNVEKRIEQVLAASKDRGSFKEGNKSLLILDDCASCKEVKKQDGALSTAAFGSRHQGLSVIFLTQQFTSVAKAWRDNQDYFVFFRNPNYEDMVVMFKRFLGRTSKEEREAILDELETTYARLELNMSGVRVFYRVALPDKPLPDWKDAGKVAE